MTPTERAAFLAQRKTGIGGSDVAALYNEGYSCRKRLWLDKTDATPDFPREENTAMRLGTFMEQWFADEYARKTGRGVSKLATPLQSAESGPLRVNVDRLISRDSEDPRRSSAPGVLEIKSMGREMFYRTKREGLSRSYILQLQAGMIAADASWGSFCVGSRENGEIQHFDVERDDTLCKDIVADAKIFWAQVQNGPIPDALEPDDPRCRKCEYRLSCQGINWGLPELQEGDLIPAPELIQLVQEKKDRDALYDQAVALCAETDEELKSRLGDRQAVIVGADKVYWRPQAGRALVDGKGLLEAYKKAYRIEAMLAESGEDILGLAPPESFVSTSKPSRPLRLFPAKGGR